MDHLTDIPDEILEQLRCSQCKKYLSCGPVRSLLDGTCICGRCSPLNTTTAVHRVLPLELTLKKIPFPCSFKEQGCKEFVIFDQAFEHELKCSYRLFPCPLRSLLHCTWNGSALEIQDHFIDNHSSCLLDNVSFTIEVHQNSQRTLAAVHKGVVFLVTYLYQADSRNLNYDVRYFSSIGSASVLYNVQLSSDLPTKSNMDLEKTPCSLVDETFNNSSVLNLSKYLECFKDPIKVKVNVNFEVSNLAQKTVDETVHIDYDKLDTLRCGKCRAYLALPIFEQYKDGSCTCCCVCAQRFNISTESTNAKLQQRIAETIYPCRWRSCSFISKGDTITEHEESCHLRDYQCCISDCSALFTIATAKEHLENHGARYMHNNTYTILFVTSEIPQIQFVIENNKLFVFEHEIINRRNYECSVHKMSVLLDSFVDQQKAVHFEHEHCKVRSWKYLLGANQSVGFITNSELPSCFLKNDLLYVKLSYH